MTTLRDNHLAAATALDGLAARCAFDEKFASELRKLAARSRILGDCARSREVGRAR
jgi:hypothetical protein